ncbi:MAG: hypothetical protein V3U96_02925 [Paracoccaceae bacterium]
MSDAIQSILSILGNLQNELIGFGFTIVGALLFYLFRPRVKLIYGRANHSRNVVSVPSPDPEEKSNPTEIYVEKFFLQNSGRKTATNVEFVLSAYPADISVFQPRDVQYKNVEKGNCLIAIPQIAPGELVAIDCVYLNQIASIVSSVKCAECLGKSVPFWTTRRYPNWVFLLLWALIFFGVASLIQITIKLLGS